MGQAARKQTIDIKWPYRMQPHPDDPNKLGTQQVLELVLAPAAPYKRIGFGGPKGGGKSYGARALAFTLAYEYPITIVLVRSRLKTLKRNHIIPAKNELRDYLKEGIIDYNEQDKIFYMPSGGIVQFMHCFRKSDVAEFEGVSADLYIFEEAVHFTEDMLTGILKNNRPSDIAINRAANYSPRALFTFNWGGPGHNLMRRWFWDEVYEKNENPDDYFYIFADLFQNRALLDVDPGYVDNLKGLPEQLRRAYLDGDPDAFVGQMFMIIRDYHEVDPVEILEPYNEGRSHREYMIPDHWRLIGSLDAGIGAPCAFGLYALTPTGKRYKIFTYKDVKRTAQLHINSIMHQIDSCRWTGGRHPEFIVADSYAFQKHSSVGENEAARTWEDLFADPEIAIPMHPVKYDRLSAIMGLQTALHFELNEDNTELEYEPALQFFKGANEPAIEELQSAERSEVNPELMGDRYEDHVIDEMKNLHLTAESPPDYVALKKRKKKNPKSDYGSGVDRLKQLFSSKKSETFRDPL